MKLHMLVAAVVVWFAGTLSNDLAHARSISCPSGFSNIGGTTLSGFGWGLCAGAIANAHADLETNLNSFRSSCASYCDPCSTCVIVQDFTQHLPSADTCDTDNLGMYWHTDQMDVLCCQQD
jgi:hypothetical protein